MAANASLIVTKRNDNKGRIYRVESPKTFKLAHDESGSLADESAIFYSQEQETDKARRICKCLHYSFLCREVGLPCSASALITEFIVERQPFIFAEPGDIWIDIRLSTPSRTYVLARRDRESDAKVSEDLLRLQAKSMILDYLEDVDETELLSSADEIRVTPNAGMKIMLVAVDYAADCHESELGAIIER
jgi:hypothetical protein